MQTGARQVGQMSERSHIQEQNITEILMSSNLTGAGEDIRGSGEVCGMPTQGGQPLLDSSQWWTATLFCKGGAGDLCAFVKIGS